MSRTAATILSSMAIALALAIGCPANATTILFETGFESPDYALGDLNGQQGWIADAFPGECFVTDAFSFEGSQSLFIWGDGYPDGNPHLGAAHSFADPVGIENIVTAGMIAAVSPPTTTGNDYFIVLGDGVNVAGYLHFVWNQNISVNGVSTGYMYPYNAPMIITMVADFDNETFDVDIGGTLVAEDYPFVSPGMSALNEVLFAVDDLDAGQVMVVDALSIVSTPEPGTLSLLAAGVCGIAVLKRNRRKA